MKDLKKLLVLLISMMLICSMLSGCGGSSGSEDSGSGEAASETASGSLEDDLAGMKDMNLNWAISMGSSHKVNEVFQYFSDEINKRTNGKITITNYPGDTLVTSNSIYDSLAQGVIDMGEADPAYSVAAFPLISAYFLPGMNYDNSVVATHVADELFTESGLEELNGAHYLFAYGMTPSIVFGNKKTESLADFKGMQIRATGYAIPVVEGLGAAAVGITPAETYEALMKGTADAALMPAEALMNWNFAEVCDYACNVKGFSTSMHYIAINIDVWNSLPASVQALFEEVADECVEKVAPMWDGMAEEGYNYAKEQNTEVYDMSEEDLAECITALEPVREKWVEDNASKGDSQGVLDYVTGLVDKYNAQYGN